MGKRGAVGEGSHLISEEERRKNFLIPKGGKVSLIYPGLF